MSLMMHHPESKAQASESGRAAGRYFGLSAVHPPATRSHRADLASTGSVWAQGHRLGPVNSRPKDQVPITQFLRHEKSGDRLEWLLAGIMALAAFLVWRRRRARAR